jgi:hypothetical protein
MGEEFRREQRAVLISMVAALMVSAIILGAASTIGPADAGPFSERLRFAVRADLLVVAWLAAAIANVARLRFFSEIDIGGSSADKASKQVRDAGAILQNTLEQAFLAIVTGVVVVATIGRSDAIVGAIVALFALGRLLFWLGYRHGASHRAFGFALTFYPNVLALLGCAVVEVYTLLNLV